MSVRTNPPENETTLADVKQLGMWASIASLSYVFWVVGGMEMVERLAFYGVRSVATIYATRSTAEGGLAVTMTSFGTLLLCWNLVQSLVPIFTGGLSDRYGYKQTIFVSTVLKSIAYLTMAWIPTYAGFFLGAMLLATGTAIFKPGIQATLVRATGRHNSSMAWGIFYQTVNIGGWIGPLIALQMRQMQWKYVFYTNAAIICANFILLLTYREPGKAERIARRERIRHGAERQQSLVLESLNELRKPHLLLYLLIFSVWWLMFPMLWDVLPKYVDEWVDTSSMVRWLFGPDGTQNPVFHFLLGIDKTGKTIQPEGIVNINAGVIMFTCFLFAALSARLGAIRSLFVGTLFVVAAFSVIGSTPLIGLVVLALIVFSIGEMLASPKYSEFLGNIAPPDKKAMWIGFSQAPILIGWTIEGKLGPTLYDLFSSKDELARRMLMEHGVPADQVTHGVMKVGEAFPRLVALTGQDPHALTRLLYEQHHVGTTWFVFSAIGLLAAAMILCYGLWLKKRAMREHAPE